MIRLGLGDMKKIWYYRNAIKDPPTANKNPTLRPFVAEVLEKLVDMIFRDQVLYNRVRALLTKSDHTRGENELPEDTDDIFERKRFERWKAGKVDESFSSHSTAELAHMMASCADPARKARLAQELRRRTGQRVRRTQLRPGGR